MTRDLKILDKILAKIYIPTYKKNNTSQFKWGCVSRMEGCFNIWKSTDKFYNINNLSLETSQWYIDCHRKIIWQNSTYIMKQLSKKIKNQQANN